MPITHETFDHIKEAWSTKTPFYKLLPDRGDIKISKELPYLLIYRYPEKNDTGTDRLVSGEAAYTRFESSKTPEMAPLISKIAQEMSAKYGAFLLVEIYSTEEESQAMVIHSPTTKAPATVEKFKSEFEKVDPLLIPAVKVKCQPGTVRGPQGMDPLFSLEELRKTNTLYIGLEVPVHFRNGDEFYAIYFRALKKVMSLVLRRSLHEFIRVQTVCEILNYRMLGASDPGQMVYDIDKQLTAIEKDYRFLMLLAPTNTEECWEKFKSKGYEGSPDFTYRLLSVDPDKLRRDLFNVDLSLVDDPALEYVLRDKRNELDIQLSMLDARNTKNFMYDSLRLYGRPDQSLVDIAEQILSIDRTVSEETRDNNYFNAQEFAKKAAQEYDHYRKIHPGFNSTIQIRNDLRGVMVSKGDLFISEGFRIHQNEIDGILHHEVGTHVLTFYNGLAQPLKLLSNGLADYDELQEGLAVLAEYLVGDLTQSRLRVLAARVVVADRLVEGATFTETFNELHKEFNCPARRAYYITARIYQDGGFTKDIIYLKGFIELLAYLQEGNPLDPLYIGKIALKHAPVIQELKESGFLIDTPMKPRFYESAEVQKKLKHVIEGVNIFDEFKDLKA